MALLARGASTTTGARSEVSSWRARPGAAARLSAASAVDLDDIASLEIQAVASGKVLMRGIPGEPPPR